MTSEYYMKNRKNLVVMEHRIPVKVIAEIALKDCFNIRDMFALSQKLRDNFCLVTKEEDDLTPIKKENLSLNDLKQTWMSKLNIDSIFISALDKINFDELREILYERVKAMHVKRYPYNNFLY